MSPTERAPEAPASPQEAPASDSATSLLDQCEEWQHLLGVEAYNRQRKSEAQARLNAQIEEFRAAKQQHAADVREASLTGQPIPRAPEEPAWLDLGAFEGHELNDERQRVLRTLLPTIEEKAAEAEQKLLKRRQAWEAEGQAIASEYNAILHDLRQVREADSLKDSNRIVRPTLGDRTLGRAEAVGLVTTERCNSGRHLVQLPPGSLLGVAPLPKPPPPAPEPEPKAAPIRRGIGAERGRQGVFL